MRELSHSDHFPTQLKSKNKSQQSKDDMELSGGDTW
jgi:hypothetical protein